MMPPLPAEPGASSPRGTPVSWYRASAARVALPISKQRPLTLFSPFLHQRTKRPARSAGIERALIGDQAVGLTERHGRVVDPFAGLQVERAAAHHVRDVRIGVPLPELDSRAQSVADRKADEGAERAILNWVRRNYVSFHCLSPARRSALNPGPRGAGLCGPIALARASRSRRDAPRGRAPSRSWDRPRSRPEAGRRSCLRVRGRPGSERRHSLPPRVLRAAPRFQPARPPRTPGRERSRLGCFSSISFSETPLRQHTCALDTELIGATT